MSSGAPIGVLVVDESEAFLASTVRWIESRTDLRLLGTARNAQQALEAVERLCPDLVIVEAALHGTDGFRLSRALKERKNAPLVLLVTFHASAAAREEAYASGADGFLAKYDFDDEIETILEHWRSERRSRAQVDRTKARPAPGDTCAS